VGFANCRVAKIAVTPIRFQLSRELIADQPQLDSSLNVLGQHVLRMLSSLLHRSHNLEQQQPCTNHKSDVA
jgi:hypothetical protein